MRPSENLTAARFIPAVLLLSTILLLTVILASLGRQTLEREKQLLLDLKVGQARTMLRSIASASRISAMMGERGQQLKRFISDTAQTEEVIFIAVYGSRGNLLAASPGFKSEEPRLSVQEMRQRLGDLDHTSGVEHFGDLGSVFLFVGKYHSMDSAWVHLRMLELPSIPGVNEESETPAEDASNFVLIAMGTGDLDDAVAEGMRQALLNGFLILLLGTIGFYFLILVQGYYSTRSALADFRQYTLDVIEGMAEGFINVDPAGILRSINPEAESILGVRAKDYLGKHLRELFSTEEWDQMTKLLGNNTSFYDIEVPPGSSDRNHLGASMIPVRVQEGANGMVLFLRDMGEVKGLQAEVRRSERLAALGRLVAGMAHEIRNPLNSISGYSQHLKGKFDSDTSEGKALDVIVKEVERLNRVITELLDFSRPREPELKPLDLCEIVRSTHALIARETSSQGVTVVEELPKTQVMVMGHADTLKQLLLNLLLNALQVMPEGGVLTIQTGVYGTRPFLKVSDTGPGIPEEKQERIFEPFYTTRESGTGLGLAIVHRIVLDHGAEIRVESSPGAGAAFVVRFP
ncbi:ATP-binding protein, partial [bacterium]|nr:ATP-binding protein [bacterium]